MTNHSHRDKTEEWDFAHPQIEVSDDTLFARAQDIVDLLLRASKLGYTLSLGPEQMNTLIAILENARLLKSVSTDGAKK